MKISEDLRRAVLQAAIQGKLTEQRPEDGTAEDLLKKIQEEKERLIAEGKIKREKTLSPVKDDEIPFEIPENWKWCNVQAIFFVHSSIRIHQTDWKNEGIPFFRGRELVQLAKTGNPKAEIFISLELYEKNKAKRGVPKKGDILISAVGTLGKVYVVKGTKPFYYKDAYILCLDNIGKIYSEYAKYVFESPYIQAMIKNDSMATTVSQLTIEKLKSLYFPLPPLTEQHRIVERIDALMSKIDDLDKAETELEIIKKNFPIDMRNAILQAAIQGKLTKQKPEDGTAKDLLKKIRVKKEKLIAEGKIKAKTLPPITDDEIPFEIPENWEWARLGKICKIYTGNSISADEKKLKYSGLSDGLDYIGTKDISFEHKITYDNGILIPLKDNNFRRARANSVLLCIEGGSAGKKIAITNREVCFGNKLCNFDSEYFSNFYIYFYLQSPTFRKIFLENLTGIIGGVSIEKLKSLLIPLPPLAEQNRIVERLNELLPLCDLMRGEGL